MKPDFDCYGVFNKNVWGFQYIIQSVFAFNSEISDNLLYIKWKCYKTIVGAITWVSFIFYAKCLTSVKQNTGCKDEPLSIFNCLIAISDKLS